MSKKKTLLMGLVFGMIAAGLLYSQAAEAYQIKRVIRGTQSLGAVEINSLDLTTPTNYLGGTLLDPAKCLVMLTMSTASSEPADTHVYAMLDDEQTISFVRFVTDAVTVNFTIIEFASGVTTYSGLTVFGDCTTQACRTKVITLPESLDLSRTLAFVKWKSYSDQTATTKDEMHIYTVEFTAANKLTIRRTDSTSQAFNDVYYQIIQFDEDVSVQSGTGQIAYNGTTFTTGAPYTTGTVSVTNGSKSVTGSGTTWLSTMTGRMFEVGGAGKRYKFTRTGNTTGTIEPAYEGATASGQSYELGEFLDVDVAKSILFTTYRGGTGIAGDEVLLHIDGEMTDLDTLTFRRFEGGSTNDEVDLSWFVLTFTGDGGYTQRNRLALNTGAGAASNQTISETERTRTLQAHTASMNTGTNSSTYWDDISYRSDLTSNTNLQFVRNSTGGTSVNVSWFTAEFPAIKVLTPDGGETLRVGDPYDIQFEFADEVQSDSLTIQAYLNGAWRTIATPTAPSSGNSATYAWNPVTPLVSSQNTIGTTIKIRVLDSSITVGTPDRNYDDSNANFEIKGKITLTAPVTTQTWVVGNTETISWSNNGHFTGLGTAGQGTIYYSTAGASGPWTVAKKTDGSDANNIDLGSDSGSGGTNNFTWKIPDEVQPGNNVYIKIEKNNDAATVTTSPTAINIKRGLTITYPNAASLDLDTQEVCDITWDYRGQTNFGTIKLQYTNDQGVNWYDITGATALAVNNGSAVGDNPPFDGKGKFSWTIPNDAVTSPNGSYKAKIRIISNSDASVTDDSDNYFSINPTVKVENPNAGGLVLYVGDVFNNPTGIQWTASPAISQVDIYYTTNGVDYTEIASGVTASTGSYPWTVPAAVSSTVKIRVRSYPVPTYSDDSDNNFTIKAKVTNVQPTGGTATYETDIANAIKIRWTPSGNLGNVKIYLSAESDYNSWPTVLSASVAGGSHGVQQTFDWNPSDTPSPNGIRNGVPGNYKIKIALLGDESNVFAVSANPFRVIGKVTLSVPSSSVASPWRLNHPAGYDLTWTKSPAELGNVALEYTDEEPENWIAIGLNGTQQTNQLRNWVPPNSALPASSAIPLKFRVSLSADPTNTFAVSEDVVIRPFFTITSPNGNSDPNLTDTFQVTNNMLIDWDSVDEAAVPTDVDLGPMRIEYTTDGSAFTNTAVDTDVLTSSISPTSNYLWTIPTSAESNTVRFRIESQNFPDLYDESTYNVKILPKVVMYQHNGGLPVWLVDSAQDVKWRYYGATGNPTLVNLFYSINGDSGPWVQFAGPLSSLGSDGEISTLVGWSVADAITSTAKLKVEHNTLTTVSDVSDATFVIRGAFDFITPPASPTAILRVGGSYSIQWTNHGTMPAAPTRDIKLSYSINGTDYTEITTLR